MNFQKYMLSVALFVSCFGVAIAQDEVYCGCPELDWFLRDVVDDHNCPSVAPKRTEVWEFCGKRLPPLVMHGACCGATLACRPKKVADQVTPKGTRCRFERWWLNNTCDLFNFCRLTKEQYYTYSCAPCQVASGQPPEREFPTLVGDWSPILLALGRKGLRLTSAEQGIQFDLNGNGTLEQTAWTDAHVFQGFLALDRNQNGQIDDGRELFGNFTDQPPSSHPNGFEALIVLDENQDGRIDPLDSIYGQLRVWIDSSHDGITDPGELQTLTILGITSIDLKYRLSRRKDRHGNQFRYRAKVTYQNGKEHFAYDVFLKVAGEKWM